LSFISESTNSPSNAHEKWSLNAFVKPPPENEVAASQPPSQVPLYNATNNHSMSTSLLDPIDPLDDDDMDETYMHMPPKLELEQPIVKQEIFANDNSNHSPSPSPQPEPMAPLMLPLDKSSPIAAPEKRPPSANNYFDHFQEPMAMVKHEPAKTDSPAGPKSPHDEEANSEKQSVSDPVDSDEFVKVLDEVKKMKMRTKPISSFSDTDDKVNKIEARKVKDKKRERRKYRKHLPATAALQPIAPLASSSDSDEDGGFSSSNQLPAAANRRSKSIDKERKRGRPRKNAAAPNAPPSKKHHSDAALSELSSGSKKHEMSPIKTSAASLFVPHPKKESSVSSSSSPKKTIRSRRASRVNSNIKSRETLDTTESSSDDEDGKTPEENLLFPHSPKKNSASKKHKERLPAIVASPKKLPPVPSKTMQPHKSTSDESDDGHISDDDEEGQHNSR
jgi:hypothetical protein